MPAQQTIGSSVKLDQMPTAVRIGQAAVIAVALTVLWIAFSPARMMPSAPLVAAADRLTMTSIRLKDLNGQTWMLDDQLGKIVIVNFWATWCPPCRQETPGLVRVARAYGGRGLKVVGISMDEGGLTPVVKFASDYGIPYPILLPGKGFALADRVDSLPTTFLIDQRGRIAKTYIGAVNEDTFHQDLDRLLVE
jgi:cytochrome c biogenesis protein CcmG, thiol:disulfide interchange protein DsbE